MLLWTPSIFWFSLSCFNKYLVGFHTLSRDITAVEWRWTIHHHLVLRLKMSWIMLSPPPPSTRIPSWPWSWNRTWWFVTNYTQFCEYKHRFIYWMPNYHHTWNTVQVSEVRALRPIPNSRKSLLVILFVQKYTRNYFNWSHPDVFSLNILIFFVFFLLGNSPASEFYMPTFRNTLSVPSS